MKGFTLIETLVAVAILSVAVAGPLYTADRAYVAALIARDQLTASYLAEEGLEEVRDFRDSAYLADWPANTTNAWSDFLSNSSATYTVSQCVNLPNDKVCTIDPWSKTVFASCYVGGSDSPQCTPLWLDSNDEYTQTTTAGGAPTTFTRTLRVTEQPISGTSADEAVVAVTVTWQTNHYTYSFTATDHLTPWQ